MNKSIPILVALLSLLLIGSALPDPTYTTPKIESAQLQLVEPTDFGRILNLTKEYNIEVFAFHCQRRFNDHIITDGYYLKYEERKELDSLTSREQYWQSYGAMLEDLYHDLGNYTPEDESDIAWKNYVEQINQAVRYFSTINDCWELDNCPTVYVVSVLVRGEGSSLSAASASPLIDHSVQPKRIAFSPLVFTIITSVR